MDIAFTTWVNPDTIRWHTRKFLPQFIEELKRTPMLPNANIFVSLACFDLPDVAIEQIENLWKDCPVPVYLSAFSNEGIRRHVALYRAWNRVAGLGRLIGKQINPDYIISLNPSTEFGRDSIWDFLDTVKRLEGLPHVSAVVHSRAFNPQPGADRNDIFIYTKWGLRLHNGVVFRNLEKLMPGKFRFMMHNTLPDQDKMYLEDVACIYSGMFEGYAPAIRYYCRALTYDPVFHTIRPPAFSNPFGRVRGDNWDCALNNGWKGASDEKFFAQVLQFNKWHQSVAYLFGLDFTDQFFDQFKEKYERLKKQ